MNSSFIYDPLGRFLQTDPIFYADNMNMYAYVGNDPVNKIDPTGMNAEDDQKRVAEEAAKKAEEDRAEAYRAAGMDDPSKPLADAAKKVADGASEAGKVIEDITSPNPLAKAGAIGVIGIKVAKAGAASEKTAKDIAKRIEKDLGKQARRTFHDSKVSGAGDRTKDELKEDARALYQEAGVEIPKWLE